MKKQNSIKKESKEYLVWVSSVYRRAYDVKAPSLQQAVSRVRRKFEKNLEKGKEELTQDYWEFYEIYGHPHEGEKEVDIEYVG